MGENDMRPLDTPRGLAPRPRNLQQTLPLLRIRRQRNHPARCDHWIPQSNPPDSLPHLAKDAKVRPKILIFRNLYTRSSAAKALPVNFWQSRQWQTVALVGSASA